MKTIAGLMFFIALLSLANAQVTDLVGTWNVIEFEMIRNEESQKTLEKELRENGSVWDLFFIEDKVFRQTSNMSGTGSTDSQEGTWEVSDSKLLLNIFVGEQKIELVYNYEQRDDLLVLTRSNPMGTVKIVATFRLHKE
jgi:hypothetical protein